MSCRPGFVNLIVLLGTFPAVLHAPWGVLRSGARSFAKSGTYNKQVWLVADVERFDSSNVHVAQSVPNVTQVPTNAIYSSTDFPSHFSSSLFTERPLR